MADVATVLFTRYLKFDPTNPRWPDRDRFVLSAGHGSMLLYALLHLTGYAGMTMQELANFRQLGSKTAGHPEYGHAPHRTTTGPWAGGPPAVGGSPSGCSTRAWAMASSIITPTSLPATAASWRASAMRRSRLPGT
jgi:hypothetical protein